MTSASLAVMRFSAFLFMNKTYLRIGDVAMCFLQRYLCSAFNALFDGRPVPDPVARYNQPSTIQGERRWSFRLGCEVPQAGCGPGSIPPSG